MADLRPAPSAGRGGARRRPRLGCPNLAAAMATWGAGVLCAGVAGASLGGRGVASGLVAAAVVAAFFSSGSLPLRMTGGAGAPGGLGLLVLLTNYAFRLAAALLLLAVASGAGWVDRRAVGVSVIVCALVEVNTRVLLLRGVRGT